MQRHRGLYRYTYICLHIWVQSVYTTHGPDSSQLDIVWQSLINNAGGGQGEGHGIGRGVAMGHAPIQNTCTQLLDPAEAQASANAPV